MLPLWRRGLLPTFHILVLAPGLGAPSRGDWRLEPLHATLHRLSLLLRCRLHALRLKVDCVGMRDTLVLLALLDVLLLLNVLLVLPPPLGQLPLRLVHLPRFAAEREVGSREWTAHSPHE